MDIKVAGIYRLQYVFLEVLSDVTCAKGPWCAPQNDVIMFLHMNFVLHGGLSAFSECHIHEAWVRPAGTIQSYIHSVAVT